MRTTLAWLLKQVQMDFSISQGPSVRTKENSYSSSFRNIPGVACADYFKGQGNVKYDLEQGRNAGQQENY